MPGCCVCYTTDPGYLFPSFVSAVQARRQISPGKADVAIFCFDADPETEAQFRRACDSENIRFYVVDRRAIDGAPVMLARLFLTRFVPVEYDQFLYIDGDTQVAGSLDPLVDAVVPPGRFLAANDPMTFAVPGTGAHSRFLADHFASVGFSVAQSLNYFNTGVLRIARDGWEGIGLAAWDLFRRQDAASRFPDQDILNLTGAAGRMPMSLAWNFPIFMLNARVAAHISPRIYHFMSKPKPWQGVFPPWTRSACQPYRDIVRVYPALGRYLVPMPARDKIRYHLQQRYKRMTENVVWGSGGNRRRIIDYERRVADTLA